MCGLDLGVRRSSSLLRCSMQLQACASAHLGSLSAQTLCAHILLLALLLMCFDQHAYDLQQFQRCCPRILAPKAGSDHVTCAQVGCPCTHLSLVALCVYTPCFLVVISQGCLSSASLHSPPYKHICLACTWPWAFSFSLFCFSVFDFLIIECICRSARGKASLGFTWTLWMSTWISSSFRSC